MVGSVGGLTVMESQIIKMRDEPSTCRSSIRFNGHQSMVAGNISMKIGARGVCTSLVTACATELMLLVTFHSIKQGTLM